MITKWIQCMVVLVSVGIGSAGCIDGGGESGGAFPEFRDENGNAINDHVEVGTHFVSTQDPQWHEFVDGDRDGVCDRAQGSNPAWHGPGYIDEDGDGICDYWDTDMPRHQNGRRDIIHGSDFSEVGPRGPQHH